MITSAYDCDFDCIFVCVSLGCVWVFVCFFLFVSLGTMCPSLWESEQRKLGGEANRVYVCACTSITHPHYHEDCGLTVGCSPLRDLIIVGTDTRWETGWSLVDSSGPALWTGIPAEAG